MMTPEPTARLLHTAMLKAQHIREELAELREHVFVSATGRTPRGGVSGVARASPLARLSTDKGHPLQHLLLLPGGDQSQRQAAMPPGIPPAGMLGFCQEGETAAQQEAREWEILNSSLAVQFEEAGGQPYAAAHSKPAPQRPQTDAWPPSPTAQGWSIPAGRPLQRQGGPAAAPGAKAAARREQSPIDAVVEALKAEASLQSPQSAEEGEPALWAAGGFGDEGMQQVPPRIAELLAAASQARAPARAAPAQRGAGPRGRGEAAAGGRGRGRQAPAAQPSAQEKQAAARKAALQLDPVEAERQLRQRLQQANRVKRESDQRSGAGGGGGAFGGGKGAAPPRRRSGPVPRLALGSMNRPAAGAAGGHSCALCSGRRSSARGENAGPHHLACGAGAASARSPMGAQLGSPGMRATSARMEAAASPGLTHRATHVTLAALLPDPPPTAPHAYATAAAGAAGVDPATRGLPPRTHLSAYPAAALRQGEEAAPPAAPVGDTPRLAALLLRRSELPAGAGVAAGTTGGMAAAAAAQASGAQQPLLSSRSSHFGAGLESPPGTPCVAAAAAHASSAAAAARMPGPAPATRDSSAPAAATAAAAVAVGASSWGQPPLVAAAATAPLRTQQRVVTVERLHVAAAGWQAASRPLPPGERQQSLARRHGGEAAPLLVVPPPPAAAVGRKRPGSMGGMAQEGTPAKRHSPEAGRLQSRIAQLEAAAGAGASPLALVLQQLPVGPPLSRLAHVDPPQQHQRAAAAPAGRQQASPARRLRPPQRSPLARQAAWGSPVAPSRASPAPHTEPRSAGRSVVMPMCPLTHSPPKKGARAGAAAHGAAAATAVVGEPLPWQHQDQQHAGPAPAAAPLHQQQPQGRAGQTAGDRVNAPAGAAWAGAAADPASPRGMPEEEGEELPYESVWVSSSRAQVAGEVPMPPPEVQLRSSLYVVVPEQQAAAMAPPPPMQQQQQHAVGAAASPRPQHQAMAEEEQEMAAAVVDGLDAAAIQQKQQQLALVVAPPVLGLRLGAALEAPAPGNLLRDSPLGRALLGEFPEGLGTVGQLLGALRRGVTVHKAWVRPNFRQGRGSVRQVQLVAGSGGRAEMQYAHGLLRTARRFAVRRAVVPGGWQPGAYLVVDTPLGMLRLAPRGPEHYALWVLGLNAALNASSSCAPPRGGSSAGGGGRLLEQRPRQGGSGREGGDGVAAGQAAEEEQLLEDMQWNASLLIG